MIYSGLSLCLNDQENRKHSKSGGSPRLITSYKTYDIFEFEIEKCEVVEILSTENRSSIETSRQNTYYTYNLGESTVKIIRLHARLGL